MAGSDELNPWLAAEARFNEAAQRLNMDDGLRKVLRTPSRELTVYIPVLLDDGRIEVFSAGSGSGSARRNDDRGFHIRGFRHATPPNPCFHEPPFKPYVRFSRIRLNHDLRWSGCDRNLRQR